MQTVKIIVDQVQTSSNEMKKFIDSNIRFFIEDVKKTAKVQEVGIDITELMDRYIDKVWSNLKVIFSEDVIDWISWYCYDIYSEANEKECDWKTLANDTNGNPLFSSYDSFLDYLVELNDKSSTFVVTSKSEHEKLMSMVNQKVEKTKKCVCDSNEHQEKCQKEKAKEEKREELKRTAKDLNFTFNEIDRFFKTITNDQNEPGEYVKKIRINF